MFIFYIQSFEVDIFHRSKKIGEDSLSNAIVAKPTRESRLVHPITKSQHPTRLVDVSLKKYAVVH